MPNIIKTTNPTKRHTRKRVLIVVGVVILLAAGLGGFRYWDATRPKATNQDETALKKLDNNGLANEINKLVEEKKYDEASELIKHQDEATTDPSKIVMRARVLNEQGKSDEALKLLRDAAAKNDKNAYYYVGHEAYTLSVNGDKQGAIEKFKTAIDMASKVDVDPNDEDAQVVISNHVGGYKFELEGLEGRQ